MPARKSSPHKRLSAEKGLALAKVLREARASAGLTQEDVATAAGLSVQLVRRIESGSANPTIGTLAAVVDALHVDVASVFARAGI